MMTRQKLLLAIALLLVLILSLGVFAIGGMNDLRRMSDDAPGYPAQMLDFAFRSLATVNHVAATLNVAGSTTDAFRYVDEIDTARGELTILSARIELLTPRIIVTETERQLELLDEQMRRARNDLSAYRNRPFSLDAGAARQLVSPINQSLHALTDTVIAGSNSYSERTIRNGRKVFRLLLGALLMAGLAGLTVALVMSRKLRNSLWPSHWTVGALLGSPSQFLRRAAGQDPGSDRCPNAFSTAATPVARHELKPPASPREHDLLARTEDHLRQLRLALDLTADGLIIMAVDGTIEYANASFARLAGVRVRNVVGRRPEDLIPGLADARAYATLWNKLSGDQPWEGRIPVTDTESEVRQLYWSATPIGQSSTQPTTYAAYVRDITAQQRLDELPLDKDAPV